jgi:hypothetical protein
VLEQQIPACHVFDQMAARTFYLNFAILFGGVDSNNVGHTMVVVVCQIELFCEIPKCVRSCFCFKVATCQPYVKQ